MNWMDKYERKCFPAGRGKATYVWVCKGHEKCRGETDNVYSKFNSCSIRKIN